MDDEGRLRQRKSLALFKEAYIRLLHDWREHHPGLGRMSSERGKALQRGLFAAARLVMRGETVRGVTLEEVRRHVYVL